MSIKIGNTSDYILLRDFEVEGSQSEVKTETIEFIQASIQLRISGFSSDIRAYFRLNELQQLENDVVELYKSMNTEIKFGNFEDNISLTISPKTNGHIEIAGYLRNSDYTGRIEMIIETDQSYLPELISEIKDIIKELRTNKYVL